MNYISIEVHWKIDNSFWQNTKRVSEKAVSLLVILFEVMEFSGWTNYVWMMNLDLVEAYRDGTLNKAVESNIA